MPKFIPSNIPEELKSESFMLWRYEERDGRKTKPPLNPNTGLRGDVTDPIQWTDYETALGAHQSGRYRSNGISVVVHPDSGLVGLDLDHCIVDGKFSEEAQEIVDGVCSYSEISPSGEGVRIFLYGKLPDKGRRRGNFECYDKGRHLTVTGNHIQSTPDKINNNQETLDWFHRKFIAGEAISDETEIHKLPDQINTESDQSPSQVSTAETKSILEKIRASKQKDKFDRLFKGDIAEYSSQSEADLALCSILAFWTGRNNSFIDEVFRKSGLFRQKWDEKHFSDGTTYGQSTINKSIENCKEVYTPKLPASVEEIKRYFLNQERGDAELLSEIFEENYLKFDDISQIFVNQGPGNFSGLRGSLATAKGVSLSKNLNLFGYNTFIWSCAKFFNKKDPIYSLIKFREKYFIKKFDKNLNSISKVEEITEEEIIKKYSNKFKVIPKNATKYFDKKILKLNNLSIENLDHNELEFLQLRGLLDKDLIKPLYLG